MTMLISGNSHSHLIAERLALGCAMGCDRAQESRFLIKMPHTALLATVERLEELAPKSDEPLRIGQAALAKMRGQ
jgi:CRISPR/Cas system-associated endoribonuclease Cas2